MVNGALRENDWSSHYFVDPLKHEEQKLLYNEIERRSFIILCGTRASGKSTRVMRTISELEKNNYV